MKKELGTLRVQPARATPGWADDAVSIKNKPMLLLRSLKMLEYQHVALLALPPTVENSAPVLTPQVL